MPSSVICFANATFPKRDGFGSYDKYRPREVGCQGHRPVETKIPQNALFCGTLFRYLLSGFKPMAAPTHKMLVVFLSRYGDLSVKFRNPQGVFRTSLVLVKVRVIV